MSDEQVVDVEARALEMGWLPKDQYKGRAENWKPAEQYVKDGETFIPFLKHENKRLERKLSETSTEVQTLRATLAETTQAIADLKEFRNEFTVQKVEAQRDQLVEQIVTAREAGDVAGEIKLQDKLAQTREALKPVVKQEEVKPKPVNINETPEWKQFLIDNPWFEEDHVMAAAANAIGAKLASEGKLSGMSQAERLAEIAKATRARFQLGEPSVRQSKVSAARGSGQGGGRVEGGQTFDDLPADVKAGAAMWESKLVGPNKIHKTKAEFHASYAETYFRKQANE